MINKIVSGGQTGADRAALDWAIKRGVLHAGWCPAGRKAEDGVMPPRYQLTETEGAGYRARTVRNVRDSDGTLITNIGELEGGSLETMRIAERRAKAVRVVQLDQELTQDELVALAVWLQSSQIQTLNVAGPRESKRPAIYRATCELLDQLFPLALVDPSS